MNRFLPLLLCLGLLTALSGCASRMGPTGLGIEAVRVVRAADGTATVDLVLLNPSVVAFNIASSTHTLELDGRTVGKIRVTQPTGLAAQSQATLSAPLELAKGVSLPAGPKASYRLQTELTLRLYADQVEFAKLSAAGVLAVVTK